MRKAIIIVIAAIGLMGGVLAITETRQDGSEAAVPTPTRTPQMLRPGDMHCVAGIGSDGPQWLVTPDDPLWAECERILATETPR